MFRWLERRRQLNKYRETVLHEFGLITMPRGQHARQLWVDAQRRIFPNIDKLIADSYRENAKSDEIAVTIASIVLTAEINKRSDEQLCEIISNLQKWGKLERPVDEIRDRIKTLNNEFPKDIDGLQWIIQCAIIRVDDLYCHGRIDSYFNDLFTSEIHGALRRELTDERAKNRILRVLDQPDGKAKDDDVEPHLKAIREAATAGQAESQYDLGDLYAKGFGVPPDQVEAARWYRLAADQGYSEAQLTLGVMCLQGQGVPQNYAEAMRWFRRAADQNHAGAQFNLGLVYANGWGVQTDETEAMTWYRRAADQGHANAQHNLGLMRETS